MDDSDDSLVQMLTAELALAASRRRYETELNPIELMQRVYRRDLVAQQLSAENVEEIKLSYPTACLRTGPYRFIIGYLGETDETEARFQEVLTLAAVARSWLGSVHEVDLNLIFVGKPQSAEEPHWRQIAQIIERDEMICRKFVWLPPATIEERQLSLTRFIQRTPLAAPWMSLDLVSERNLDAADYLMNTLGDDFLTECHLSPAVLQAWLALLEEDDGSAVHLLPGLLKAVSREGSSDE